jgi:hypothetical protein
MAANDLTVLSDWPGQLNDALEMKNGFEMAFQSDSNFMANQPVRFFFPWGPFDPNAILRWVPGIRFNQAITNAKIGALLDDIGNFWEKAGDEVRYQHRYIRLHRLPNGKVGTTPRNWKGKLRLNDPWEGAIRKHIVNFRSSSAPEEEDPNHIPLGLIADIACEKILALHEDFHPLEGRDPEWKATLKRRIAEFNGYIEGYETEAICRLYYASASLSAEAREKCFELIREAQVEVVDALKQWGEPQTGDHDDEEEEEEEREESQA